MIFKKDSKLSINYYGVTDIGLVRKENQDSFGKFPPDSDDLYQSKGILFIIADGMGGHTKGKEASKLAVDLVHLVYTSAKEEDIGECLKTALETANDQIFNIYDGNENFLKMGTTCTTLVLKENEAYIAHVGDSRVFRISKNNIEQLTQDHTLVAEMKKRGILSKDEANEFPNKSVLNRAVGIKPTVEVDISTDIPIKVGDSFILCTDGMVNVTNEEIKQIVLNNTPKEACDNLIFLANNRGGKDNITVQIVKIIKNTE